MNVAEFDLILKNRCKSIERVLAAKAGEYAAAGDRLHNFKAAAKYLRGTPAQACLAFMTKHLVSVADIVEESARAVRFTAAFVDEKLGDSINYLILLEALLLENQ